MEKVKKGSLKAWWKHIILPTLVAVGIAVGGLYWEVYHNTHLFGKKILYKNTYRSNMAVIGLPSGSFFFDECSSTLVKLINTADTLLIKSPSGTVGFKPLGTDINDPSVLIALDKDSLQAFFTRRGVPNDSTAEVLIFSYRNGAAIIFSTNPDCTDIKTLFADKMSVPDKMAEEPDKLSPYR